MKSSNPFIESLKKYRFELRHLTVVFIALLILQLVLLYVNKVSLRNFVDDTQEWFQKNSAEKFAGLSASTLELLMETTRKNTTPFSGDRRRVIQFFDIILNQHVLQQNVEEICLLVSNSDKTYVIDDGRVLYTFLLTQKIEEPDASSRHVEALNIYNDIRKELKANEEIVNVLKNNHTYHIFVPFVPNGEFMGALYMKNITDVSFIQRAIISNYEETSIIYTALFLLGLLAMYYISMYTVKERDEAQKRLLDEHEKRIKQKIDFDKETLFTKRIYHTHHKAEKVMGFIKDDLRSINPQNIDEIKYRATRYSNFISRVIYDMKWYDPPIQTIRNMSFQTNLNEVVKFIVENIFNRTAKKSNSFEIVMKLDKNVPALHINEFVIWEIIEPLIQNSIDHGGDENILITISTEHYPAQHSTKLVIEDNGAGIAPELLEENENGVKILFLENITTKNETSSSGYGCYIAYEIATQRCGWSIDAENLPMRGCRFIITIPH